jgi:hypothetical protein
MIKVPNFDSTWFSVFFGMILGLMLNPVPEELHPVPRIILMSLYMLAASICFQNSLVEIKVEKKND